MHYTEEKPGQLATQFKSWLCQGPECREPARARGFDEGAFWCFRCNQPTCTAYCRTCAIKQSQNLESLLLSSEDDRKSNSSPPPSGLDILRRGSGTSLSADGRRGY